MPRIRTNFDGLVRLLAKNLYPEPDVFIRELIQNGHDAIQFRLREERNLNGRLEIFTDAKARSIRFVDNGLGMDKGDIEEFLSTIGTSGTGDRARALLEEADKEKALGTIGQFGIGFLSAFVVAESIVVVTRKVGTSKVWRWECHGGEEYTLEEVERPDVEPGSEVTLRLQPDKTGSLDEEDIRKTVRKYADFLPFGIYLNGNGPINSIDAPWHRDSWQSSQEYERALSDFLNRRFPDYPLHVIPIDFRTPRARGALYISDRHVPGINTPGLIDIFQNRMCIRINDQDLLPEWAKFVRGVIDSPDLTPTAARDNVQRDFTYHELRRHLGQLIVESLVRLSEENPARFQRLCEWHHYHLKGMALHHDDFFDAVVEYLPFETSEGSLNLRTYVSRQTAPAGGKVPVFYFSFGHDSNQFYELCRARDLIAINTGRRFEEELIRKYVRKNSRTLEARQLDTLHDERIFAPLSEEEHRRFRMLEDALRRALARLRIHNVRPEVRRFEPARMSGALIGVERGESIETLEGILRQPTILEGLGDVAEEALQKLRDAPMTLYLNANNEIVRQLAEVRDLESPRYELFLVGLYNSAILNSQHRMTPRNAQVFYDQFHDYMATSLALEHKVRELEVEREELRRQFLETTEGPADITSEKRDWIRCFVIMPFDDPFRAVEKALRAVLQGPPYYFELVLARDRLREQEMRNNVQRHLQDADFYIADISEHSPNVFLELGWPLFDPNLNSRPKILLRAKTGKPRPEDIASLIYVEYESPNQPDLEEHLRREFVKSDPVKGLLERRHGRYLSPGMLEGLPFLSNDRHRRLVCQTYQTVEALQGATAQEFARRIPREHDWLVGVLEKIQRHLEENVN